MSHKPPFEPAAQLNTELDGAAQNLPGYPCISVENKRELWDFLAREFYSNDLEHISDKLWWMSKQDSGSISPLHRQRVKRRAIVITEDPKLHLVWIYDRIFIKPLPRYILSHAFWSNHLCAAGSSEKTRPPIYRAALGYLRTYYHLVRYESDFRIAQDPSLCLIPANITWEQFSRFLAELKSISDREVSLRYTYGEIRLTRLNFYAPFLLGKSHYQRVEYQYGSYFARFYGPVLFVIGLVSVVLSALQVFVSVEDDGARAQQINAALCTSLVAIVGVCCLLSFLGFLFLYKIAKEWRFAIRDRFRVLQRRGTVD